MVEVYTGFIFGIILFYFKPIILSLIFVLVGIFFIKTKQNKLIFILFLILGMFRSFVNHKINKKKENLIKNYNVNIAKVIRCKQNQYLQVYCLGISNNKFIKFRSNKVLFKNSRVLVSNNKFIRMHYPQLVVNEIKKPKSNYEIEAFISNSEVNNKSKQILKKTGLAHLTAISGLHLSIVAILGIFIAKIIYFLIYQRFNIQRNTISIITTLPLIWIYSSSSGASISSVRAATMISSYLIIHKLTGRGNILTFLLFTASLFLFINPDLSIDISFQLSFAAVLGIILIVNLFKTSKLKILTATLGANLATTPIIWFNFKTLAYYSLYFNALFVPIFTFLIIPFTFIGGFINLFSPFLGNSILFLSQQIFSFTVFYMNFIFKTLPKLNFSEGILIFIISFLSFVLIVIKFNLQNFIIASSAIVLSIVLVLPKNKEVRDFSQKHLQIIFAKGRESDTTLIKYKNSNILIDAGYKNLLSFLKQHHIKQLDAILISHNHSDHYIGLSSIAGKIPVKIIYYRGGKIIEAIKILQKYKTKIKVAPDKFSIKKLKFNIIWPPHNYRFSKSSWLSENNSSLVLIIQYKKYKFLFTGDLQDYGEDLLLRNHKHLCSTVDIIKIAHHGHETSSKIGFLNCFKPKIAIVSGFKVSDRIKTILKKLNSKLFFTNSKTKTELSFDFK